MPASIIRSMALTLKKKLAVRTAAKIPRLKRNWRKSSPGEPKFSVFISTRAADAMSPITAGRNPANVSVTGRLSCGRVDADRAGGHLADGYNVGKLLRGKPCMSGYDLALYHGEHGVPPAESEKSDFEKRVE